MCNVKKTHKNNANKTAYIEESDTLILVHWLIVETFLYKSIIFLKKIK